METDDFLHELLVKIAGKNWRMQHDKLAYHSRFCGEGWRYLVAERLFAVTTCNYLAWESRTPVR